jgi:hypothetical protein
MQLHLTLEQHDVLVVHLEEGGEKARIQVRPATVGARTLAKALADAMVRGYGECFWPGTPTGQYWWVFRRDAETLEVAAMWTRGGASLWEHVFRATDSAPWVQGRLDDEIARLRISPSA